MVAVRWALGGAEAVGRGGAPREDGHGSGGGGGVCVGLRVGDLSPGGV